MKLSVQGMPAAAPSATSSVQNATNGALPHCGGIPPTAEPAAAAAAAAVAFRLPSRAAEVASGKAAAAPGFGRVEAGKVCQSRVKSGEASRWLWPSG